MSPLQRTLFKPGFEPYPTPDVLLQESEEILDENYWKVSEELFGEMVNSKSMKDLVVEFKEAVQKEGLIVPDYDNFYRKFLRAGGLSVANSVSVLKSYLRFLCETIKTFDDFLPMSKDQRIWEEDLRQILPARDKFGRRVYVDNFGAWDPTRATFRESFVTAIKMFEMIALEPKSQVAGVTLVIRGTGFTWGQLRAVKFDEMRTIVKIIQEGMPLWFRAIHVVDAPRYLILGYNMMRPFLSKEDQEIMFFHDTVEQLHEHVDREILPEEYGGALPRVENTQVRLASLKFQDYFEELRKLADDNRGRY